MNKKTFNIKVGEFQGSLEALLEMVQKRKLSISNISLAKVADDYISYVKNLDGNNDKILSNETASFIVIAATLLLIKSKSLLPSLELSHEEEEDIKDLEERLQLYSIYKQANNALAIHIKNNKKLYAPKQIKRQKNIVFAPANNLAVGPLSEAINDVLKQLPNINNKPKAEIAETVNIEEVMQNLLKRVEGAVQSSFRSISGANKQDVLVNFLALLELVKDGVLLAEQNGTYGEILIMK